MYLWSVDFLYAAALRVTSVCILASSELRHEAVARPFRREAVSECACRAKPFQSALACGSRCEAVSARSRFGAKPFQGGAVSAHRRACMDRELRAILFFDGCQPCRSMRVEFCRRSV